MSARVRLLRSCETVIFRQISSRTVRRVGLRVRLDCAAPGHWCIFSGSLKTEIKREMATPGKMIKFGDEEVSEKAVVKIRQEAERDLKKEIFRQVVRKDYRCWVPECQALPRPGDASFKKCYSCGRVQCTKCSRGCCRNSSYKVNVPSSLLEHLPFQCQNTKYGCQEILMKEELGEHEKWCHYQKVHCAKVDCKNDISFLNYLGK